MPSMNRREALKASTVALGGALALSSGILASCERPAPAKDRTVTGGLSALQQDLAESIADTILPKTASSPGAREAGVGPAINLLVTDCYEPDVVKRLANALDTFTARCQREYSAAFPDMSRKDREELLRNVVAESKGQSPETHWFPLMRELSLRSYFSSEVGMTKSLRYIQVPGKWVGCTPLTPGQPAWG
jgi:hypothetical protein